MKGKHVTLMWALIIVLLLSQGIFVIVVVEKQTALTRTDIQLSNSLKGLESEINVLTKSNMDAQSQLNTLQTSIGSVSSTQGLLQKQLSQLQAGTSSDFSGIISDEIKGVVTIKTDIAQGSGFIITNDGYIVTNAHVLAGGSYATVYTYDKGQYNANLIGYDVNKDVALLKINGTFQSLQLGDSGQTRIGAKVIALGNPLGLSFTATEGIISARDRTGSNNFPYYFQTDASLNPGNSGGPLIDTEGNVIGINNFKISGAENIGFALEMNYAKDIVNQIAQNNLNQTIL